MAEPFLVGPVLDRGFRVWARNLIPFTLITAVIYTPLIVWHAMHTFTRHDPDGILVGSGLGIVLDAIVSGTLTYGVVKELQGQRASLVACLLTGLRRLIPTLVVGLLVALCYLGGLILLAVPFFILACMLYVATPASVIERPGLLGALRRSRELTAGVRWHILGIRATVYVLGSFAGMIHIMVIRPQHTGRHALDAHVGLAIQIVLAALSAVMCAVTYYHLRVSKDGATANELAAVFE